MGRHSCCAKQKLRKGLWSPEEDEKLFNYITRFGVGCWSSVPKLAGLQRCGKSCRLRWINYLRPDLKRGMFSPEEEDLIISLHKILGNRWAQIASQLPGRTDNEIKNFWNSALKKKLMKQGVDPQTHEPLSTRAQSNNTDNNSNSFSENNNIARTSSTNTDTIVRSIKVEQPYVVNSIVDNGTSSLFSSALSSSPNSQFLFSEASADDYSQSYQSLLFGECQQQQMTAYNRPTICSEQSQQYAQPSVSVQLLDDNNPLNLGERASADCFSESLIFSEGKESSSSSSNNNNMIRNTSFSWENADNQNKFESEYLQYPADYESIKLEGGHDQPNSWEDEDHFKSLSLSEELAAAAAGNFDVFLQHL